MRRIYFYAVLIRERALRASSASFSLHKTAPPFESGRENVKTGARLDGGRRVINSENGARYYVKLHDVTADSRANRAGFTMITK